MATSPPTTSIPQAMRLAATDFYFNSLRFVAANVAWALTLLAGLFAAVLWPPATLLLLLSAAPVAGLHRMAALLARGEPVSLADFVDGTRRYGLQAVGLTAVAALLGVVFLANVAIGFGADGPLGWFLGATALYGLVALVMSLVAAWPILVDPRHETATLRHRLRLVAIVLIGRPGRLFILTAAIVAVLAVSTVLLAAIVLFGVGYSSLLATRWILPAVDELEARYEAARASR